MMLGARTAAWGIKTLPYDYAVEYIESDGRQYASTGVSIAQSDIVKCQVVPIGIVGAYIGNTVAWGMQFTYYGGYLVATTRNSRFNIAPQASAIGSKFIVEYSSNWCKSNGVDISPISDNNFINANDTYNIFRFHTGTLASGRIFSASVEKGGVFAFNLVPCVMDGVPCFYDSVGERFIYDENGIGFIAGPRI